MCLFTCLELSGLRLICFDHQNCLLMPAGYPIPAKVQLIDIMQALPQLCLLAVLEYPGVLFALCLECLGSVAKLRLTLYDPWTAARQASLSFTISEFVQTHVH